MNAVEKLKRMLKEERSKNEGYQDVIQLYSAYIALLLKRLDATEDKAIAITSDEVRDALQGVCEAMAIKQEGSCKLYYCEEG